MGNNWQIYDINTQKFIDQDTAVKLTPGVGDGAEFSGGSTRTKGDCVVDVGNGVTVSSISISTGFDKNLILANSLTVSGGSSLFSSNAATIRGSASGAPATRGTLTIANKADFKFSRGNFEDVSVNVVGQSDLLVDGITETRRVTATDITIGENARLIWMRGNVDVVNRPANSFVTIAYGGTFLIVADGYEWGMSTPTAPAYFRVTNHGTVRAGPGVATLRGDYSTDFKTQVDGGTLKIDGIAEQTYGTFDLLNGSTVEVTNSKNQLLILGGEIVGTGTVRGNLALGADPSVGPTQPSNPSIAPGHASPDVPRPQSVVGTLTITAQFQMFTGSMLIDVIANGQYDRVIVQGTYAALAGKLLVDVETSYKPQGASLAFLTATSFIGDFATKLPVDANWYATNGKGFYRWRYVKGATSYILEAFLTGG